MFRLTIIYGGETWKIFSIHWERKVPRKDLLEKEGGVVMAQENQSGIEEYITNKQKKTNDGEVETFLD